MTTAQAIKSLESLLEYAKEGSATVGGDGEWAKAIRKLIKVAKTSQSLLDEGK